MKKVALAIVLLVAAVNFTSCTDESTENITERQSIDKDEIKESDI